MISLTLLVSLSLAQPRAPADAQVVTWLPRIDAAARALPFLNQAGERTALLRPHTWRDVLHPLLQVDLTDAADVARVGLDGQGPLTTWQRGPIDVTCAQVKDLQAFTAAAHARLQRLGTVGPVAVKGAAVKIVGTRDALDRVQAAYAVKGTLACAMVGRSGVSVEEALPELARLVARAPPQSKGARLAKGLPGDLYVIKPSGADHGAVSLRGAGSTMTLEARARGLPLGGLGKPGPSPFAAATPPGLLVLRLRVDKGQLPALIDDLARRIPGGRALGPAAKALAPELTGNLLLFVQDVKDGASLRTAESRFFAMKLVLLAETTGPERAAQAAAAVDPASLTFSSGRLEAGARGALVFLSTDADARDAALKALPGTSSAQKHAGEMVVNPALLARALGSVPLLEAVRNPDLAGVVAASAEVGPLLLDTRALSGWLDPEPAGTQRAQLTWTLKPRPAKPPAP